MIGYILIGWCTIHALIYLALAWVAFWIVQLVWQAVDDRRPLPRLSVPALRVPSWVRAERSSARHARRGGTR